VCSSDLIGLTGGIGSGKSTVARLFAAHDVPVIDSDVIAHQLTQPGQSLLTDIQQYFGDDIVLPDGQLNRTALARRVFNDRLARQRLEDMLHPAIWQEVTRQIQVLSTDYCLLVVPLLLETGQTTRVDRILVVDTTEALQLSRTLHRDSRSENEVKAIMHAQVSRHARLQAADDIVDNTDKAELPLETQVATLHQKYRTLAHR